MGARGFLMRRRRRLRVPTLKRDHLLCATWRDGFGSQALQAAAYKERNLFYIKFNLLTELTALYKERNLDTGTSQAGHCTSTDVLLYANTYVF